MKKTVQATNYFFVDEAGDPVFYDRAGKLIVGTEGCSKILLIGFICTLDPGSLRTALEQTKKQIADDAYLAKIPSIASSVKYFHAKDDCPEVREKVFKKIVELDVRGNRIRQKPITNAIKTALLTFESKWETKITSTINVQAQTLSGEPCLQIVDYINWAVQRAFIKGEMRYFDFIRSKVSYLVDIYDTVNYPKNYYNSKNSFELTKISPL